MGLSWLLSRRIQAYVDRFASEGAELRQATERLQYRNSQLNALYNVFSEITDTLSLPYVISATTREALRVMNANIAVLRLLKNNELVAVGNLTSEGIEVDDLPPVKLGEGPTGRAAKRGKTVRIHEGAQHLLGPVAATQTFSPVGAKRQRRRAVGHRRAVDRRRTRGRHACLLVARSRLPSTKKTRRCWR